MSASDGFLFSAERHRSVERLLTPYTRTVDFRNEDARDAFFMDAALTLARQAAEEGEVPVGCVIARDGVLLTGDYNGWGGIRQALWHAETAAIAHACALLGGWRLTRCVLYVTLEPCPMCAGAIWNARIPRVVIGAKDARAGAMGSLLNLNSYPLNFKPKVTFGVGEAASRELLQAFFRSRRPGLSPEADT